MTVYLVEAYLGARREGDLVELAGRLSRAADAVSREGEPVRYLRSAYVPEDETCLHFVEAPTAAAAELLARRAELPFDRILEARSATVPIDPASMEEQR